MARKQIEQALPPMLSLLAEDIGLDAVLTLALKMGGRQITIPKNARGSALEQHLGEEAALLFCEKYAGEHLSIPNANRALAMWWNEQGVSKAEIGHRLRVSRSSIGRWLK